jgi:putative tryptophan/tyrosine transport system substrate-binding protein
MASHIRRREFIGTLASAATLPLGARAQQAGMPVLGFLGSRSRRADAYLVAAFLKGMSEAGYIEGQNVTIEFRWAEGQYERLPVMAADLVRRQVAAIVAAGTPSAFAAKAATTTIPIVFSTAVDPVATGLVASLNRPGSNVTGVTNLGTELVQKQLEMLHQLVPTATIVAALINPTFPDSEDQSRDLEAAARKLGLQLRVLHASTEHDLDTAFATMGQLRVGALVVGPDPFFFSRRNLIADLAIRHAMPTIYYLREFAAAGGLMTYGVSLTDGYRQVGIYAGRILKGEQPSDLPVQESTKFELVINLKTARALNLEISRDLLLIADEIIE